MRTPACIGILIILRLHVCVRPRDYTINKPIDVSNYPHGDKDSEICFINNKPYNCARVQSNTAHIMPYGDAEGEEEHAYSTSPSPPLMHPSSLMMSLKESMDNAFPWPTLYYPQKYRSNNEIHGSLLYNSPPLEHLKYNYEVTTAENAISHSLDDSMLPSRDNVIAGSASTTEPFFIITNSHEGKQTSTNISLFDHFMRSLDRFERKFYQTTFNKLLSISPPSRSDNGISFAQSGLFVYLALVALSTEVDSVTSAEIDSILKLRPPITHEKKNILGQVISWLPKSSQSLKFRWATRLVLEAGLPLSQDFLEGPAAANKLHVEWLNGTETLDDLTSTLNNRVKTDSGGAMRNTFEEDDFSEGTCSILLNTIYIRARWRSPPTVLNGSRPFRDTMDNPDRSVRMIRINDMMRYAFLEELSAEALEISYATANLTLLLLVPQGHTLKSLATYTTTNSLRKIYKKMYTTRVAATLPIYTLRMTLLLPGKLREMGISRLVDTNNSENSRCGELKLSHAVQRIMFWAEAGRNAYKDDGIEWDDAPEKEIIVDRPYLFYVRWKNVTLMKGNFVL